MHTRSIEDFRHAHVFLGEAHERNERKTWTVIAICAAMMIAEIVGGLWFGSVALVADGLHMSTHAGALLIAALVPTRVAMRVMTVSSLEQGSSGTWLPSRALSRLR
jgi:Co/Zn/Cd efflux system component